MPGRHRRPRRNLCPADFAAAGAAATLMIPLTAGTHATAAVSHEAAMMQAAQPSWWHAAHLAHVAHLARMASTTRAPAASTGKTWGVSYGYPNYCGDGDGDGWDVPCPDSPARNPDPAAHPLSAAQPATVQAPAATYSGGSGMQACIIARESGGNSQVMNSSGHYGLYQFSASTWAGSGGNPADFGRASAAEQNQVFANAVAARGYSDWTPYDGCR